MGAISFYPPGDRVRAWRPGDFVLVADTHRMARCTELGQRRRFRGTEWAAWNHAALVATDAGTLIEARAEGIACREPGTLDGLDYCYVAVDAKVRDELGSPRSTVAATGAARAMRWNAARFAFELASASTQEATPGQQARVCLELMADRPASRPTAGSLVAHALSRLGYVWTREPRRMLPADLALAFGARVWRGGE
jgi:hypothetical protein